MLTITPQWAVLLPLVALFAIILLCVVAAALCDHPTVEGVLAGAVARP